MAAKKKNKKREILVKELKKLIPQLDEEALIFLIKQANTSIYNLHVVEMNKKLARLDEMEKPKSRKAGRGRDSARTEAREEKFGVCVEDAPGGASFIIVLGNTRKIFSRIELQQLVKIAKTGGGDGEPGERLYMWLKKHRGDVLFDGRIEVRNHPLLKNLAYYLRTHYTVKK
ncbi:MAG: hypothetical protein EHM28_00805 [Spirochaetaceae bacterium]|nr:MAG: hypothetical protein EHM28_00805 [Spirochaetaceae bacterium]